MSQNSQERPEALREAARAMLHVRTPNEVAAAGSATVIDLAEGRITAGYANAVSSLLGRINDASFLHHISEKAKAPAGPEGIMAGMFDAMLTVTRGTSSSGNGHREPAREPGHPIRQETMDRAQRRSHENRLEEQRRELERQRQQVAANHQRAVAEQRRIEADQASVERELSRVRSEEHACGDPTLMGAR